MFEGVNLYNNAYANYGADVYRLVRIETYSEDFGQTSWVTNKESKEIPTLLGLTPDSSVLEVGCGSGGYALYLAQDVGCKLVGVDISAPGIQNANQLAASNGLQERVRFELCDASREWVFDANSFDAVFSNDVLCHLPGRARVLGEIFRVLRPGGRMLFSDALVVGGMIAHHEIATRSSVGYYVYSPPGENERLLERGGFRKIRATDTTENAAHIAMRWFEARKRHENELVALEGTQNFGGLQKFLSCVHTLTAERRLLRYLYLAEK